MRRNEDEVDSVGVVKQLNGIQMKITIRVEGSV